MYGVSADIHTATEENLQNKIKNKIHEKKATKEAKKDEMWILSKRIMNKDDDDDDDEKGEKQTE